MHVNMQGGSKLNVGSSDGWKVNMDVTTLLLRKSLTNTDRPPQ